MTVLLYNFKSFGSVLIILLYIFFSGLLIVLAIAIESPPALISSFLGFLISYLTSLMLLEIGSIEDHGKDNYALKILIFKSI